MNSPSIQEFTGSSIESTAQMEQIIERLLLTSNFIEPSPNPFTLHPQHHLALSHAIKSSSKIQFLLPAFPAKSANRLKTYSPSPDMGEVWALIRLNSLCREFTTFHNPGAQIIICSDGRVFNDLVCVKDEHVTHYAEGLQQIVEKFTLENIRFFSLEEVIGVNRNFTDMRRTLTSQFGSSVQQIRESVRTDKRMTTVFNGIHRFIKEDYFFQFNTLSRNQVEKVSKAVSYQVIQRSNAWSNLVAKHFPMGFRLSIHPQHQGSNKFPIRLLPGDDIWGTPWHRVMLIQNGHPTLQRYSEVVARGAKLRLYANQFVYFEGALA